MYKTTAQDFAVFKDEALYWLERFGLKSYRVGILHQALDSDRGLARCYWNTDGSRWAHIVLNTKVNWDLTPDLMEIPRAAFHEVCELLLSQVTTVLREERSETTVDDLTHALIITLETAIWLPDYTARTTLKQEPAVPAVERKASPRKR